MADEKTNPPIEETAEEQKPTEAITSADPDALDPELPVPRGLEVYAALEALLFAATQPLNTKRLSVLLNGVPVEEVDEALEVLKRRYDDAGCGLFLMEIAGGWQLATRPEVADWVLRLHKHRKRNPLTPSLLESMAIIAYKQPLTRAEIEAIRGVDCGTALRSLQDAGLVEIIGRKETLGRPPLYGTTELFLKTFGLKSIEELPALHGQKPTLQAPETPAEPEAEAEPEPEAEKPQAALPPSEQDTASDAEPVTEEKADE